MRISSLALAGIVLLGACGGPDNGKLAEAEAEQAKAADADGKIECALEGAAGFQRVCETEKVSGPEGTVMTIRHPDGGFRRFEVVTDGRGLVAADGADEAKIAVLDGGTIEVSAGEDRYKLPAAIKPGAGKATAAAPAKN